MQKKQNFKELTMVCFGLLFSLASLADAHPDFSAICKNWNAVTAKIYDVRFECAETNQALNTARSYLALVDDAFPFTAKAPTLEVMEFESDEEFKARVRKQSDEDAKALEQVTKMREEAKKYLVDSIEQLSRACVEMTNALNRAVADKDNFTNQLWTWEANLDPSLLPRFDRESMSFTNIPPPLASFEDAERQARFKVVDRRSICVKFSDIKHAKAFKEGLVDGSIQVRFPYQFTVSKPTDYTFREAWIEKRPNRAKQAGKAIGIAARFLQALNGGPAINQVDIAKIEHVDTDDEISHAPITGREFLVYIKDCPVEYRGPELKDMTVEWVDSN